MNTIQNGISLVVVSMNRTHHLLQSIPSWKRALERIDEPYEIIVLDWGSTIPIINTWKIILIRILKKYWHLSLAYNIVLQFTKYNKILKLDADSILYDNFFKKNILEPNTFLTGNWKLAKNENESHVNGIVYIYRELIFKISGYNEMIQTYGYDDTDLYERAAVLAQHKNLDPETIHHIPHNNKLRGSKNLRKSIISNMLLAHKYKWNGPMSQISKIKDGNPIKIQIKDTYKFISIDAADCKDFDYSMRFLSSISPRLSPSVKRKKLYIEAINGLCNRLRSFASAAVIACAINRDLILIWEPSSHCEAEFIDLFELMPLNNLPVIFTLLNKKPSNVNKKVLFLDDLQSVKEGKPSGPSGFGRPSGLGRPSGGRPSGLGMPSSHRPLEIFIQPPHLPEYDLEDEVEDLYLITANVITNKYTNWFKESDFLRQYLIPTKEILNKINRFPSVINHIGVHIRMGQKASYDSTDGWDEQSKKSWDKWRKNSHMSIFIKHMKMILTKLPHQRFFLAADEKYIYDEVLNNFDCIDYVKRTTFDRSIEQIQSGLVDLMLLSRTKFLLGSNWSTFTELAQRFGSKTAYLAGIDF